MSVSLIVDEQAEKRPSQFLSIEDKAKLTILSNLAKIKTHYLESRKTSYLHQDTDCVLDSFNGKDNPPRTEYFYYGIVNEDEGIVRVPASVFFALNEQERVLEIDKRDSVWVISKKGSGKQTKYGIARGKEAGTPPIALEEANKKLVKAVESYAAFLGKKYDEFEADASLSDSEPEGDIEEEEEE